MRRDHGAFSPNAIDVGRFPDHHATFFGDESNQNTPLGGYAKVNLHTSYDLTDNIQIYGLVDNLFDEHYGVYGTFFDVEDTNDSRAALGSMAGIKVKFN